MLLFCDKEKYNGKTNSYMTLIRSGSQVYSAAYVAVCKYVHVCVREKQRMERDPREICLFVIIPSGLSLKLLWMT